ncbi:hypothetical protein SELMODRAFT_441702 [Selaginella moellendorffii]|uniref:Glycosyltransferase n=1 Tax=Selaginella moellendorffii TaxID=88036 RepID=D8RM77_SELML|nr:7-deoxyloganetin glucosyltransferase [Selaginella moellendorffii]EFJ26840.1 hypothetical protein SELMODRAFT_441702 [Selaginella moellendorffii]|eukprot:XP_002971923.1 7-deoxyloganetin glucosyltransferase [Selaginella moellendorffii]
METILREEEDYGGGARGAAKDPSRKPHVVALAYPMQGHINPMIHLCKRLASLGLSVSLVNTQTNHDRLARSRGAALEQGLDIAMLALADDEEDTSAHQGGAGAGGDDALQRSLVAADAMERPFVALLQGLLDRGRGVDCILSDAFLGWSQDVADRFGIPRAALWASSTEYCLLNFHLLELRTRGYAPIRDASVLDDDSHTIAFIDGVAPLHPKDLPSILQRYSSHDPGFEKRYARTRRLCDAYWILGNTFQDLEPDALDAIQQAINGDPTSAAKKKRRNFSPVGPLLPSAFLGLGGDDLGSGNGLWIEDERCVNWLDKQSPSSVLYVSFGSLAVMSSAEMLELAAGIESSRQPFLWVIRPGSHLGSFDLEGFVERTRQLGLVVQWAPQLQVLFHPSVGGFLSHCGWNSTIESIAMGVPIIGLPCIAEQNLNCKRAVKDWGVGCKLQQRGDGDGDAIVGREEIERVVTRFMTGEDGMELRIRARELREAARRCVMDGGSSHKNLEAFVEAVRINGLR